MSCHGKEPVIHEFKFIRLASQRYNQALACQMLDVTCIHASWLLPTSAHVAISSECFLCLTFFDMLPLCSSLLFLFAFLLLGSLPFLDPGKDVPDSVAPASACTHPVAASAGTASGWDCESWSSRERRSPFSAGSGVAGSWAKPEAGVGSGTGASICNHKASMIFDGQLHEKRNALGSCIV